MRTSNQILIDKILLLYLMRSAEERGSIDGNLKIQKLVFLSEWKLMSSEIKALHFKYFRYHYGPFSKELLEENEALKKNGYLTRQFNLTEKAADLIDYIIEPIMLRGNNSKIFNIIDETCTEYSKITGPRLTEKVYGMTITPYDMPGATIRIRDIPAFIDILVPENFRASQKLEIPESLLADIEEEFTGRELTQKEEGRILNESADRLIEMITTKSNSVC